MPKNENKEKEGRNKSCDENKGFEGCSAFFEKCCDQITNSIYDIAVRYGLQNVQFYIDTVYQWLISYNDGVYLGCYANKIGDVVVALYHNNTIYLLGEPYRTIMYAPKLMFHYVHPNHIHIDDVLVKHNSVGNGSIAMTALFSYVGHRDIKKITGSLSSVDNDHKTRRDNYYKKFGFDVGNKTIAKIMDGGPYVQKA